MADDRAEAVRGAGVELVRRLAMPFVSIGLAVVAGSIIMYSSGFDPLAAFAAMFRGAFGGQRQLGETVLRATPLILTGLAVAWAFRGGLFNIGAEGQLFMGGLAAAWLGASLSGSPRIINVLLIILASALAGAAWAFIPALLKAETGAHEVITTMMFTYVGRYVVSWLVAGPLKAPGQIPQTVELPPESRLPTIHEALPFLAPGRAHTGALLALAVAVVVWFALRRTVLGYETRAFGLNEWAARNAGVMRVGTTIRTLCLSGALAGLAGAVEVMGVHYRLFDTFSSGLGFTGIAVALLARNDPLAVVPAALLFGALSAGAGTMQLEADVPVKLTGIIEGLVVFFVGAGAAMTLWRSHRRKRVTSDAG